MRANYYAPVGRRSRNVDSLNSAEISGTGVIFRGGEERSMGGFDAEVGWRVPLCDASADRQFRIFGGAYHFSESNMPEVSGPRVRAEMTFTAYLACGRARVSASAPNGSMTIHAGLRDSSPRGCASRCRSTASRPRS